MQYEKKKNVIYFYFNDEFDYMKIQTIKEEMKKTINYNVIKKVYFDFSNITYIDSTGIGFILARFREFNKHNISLILCNISSEHKTIFEMSGIFKIIRYQENGVKL